MTGTVAAPQVEEGKVFAIASQVVSGYVGNSTTTFVLQLMGLETATLNTVQFSNHSGYGQKTGARTSAALLAELWDGLKMNGLPLGGFDMLLTGYVPGPDELEAVGKIAIEVKEGGKSKGNCFWLLDPVMGDQGRLYVSEGVVPVYKSLLPHADLIVPNQFEAELLCGIEITSLETLSTAISSLHNTYHIPHVIITSVTFPDSGKMFCAGSSRTSTGAARKWIVDVPVISGFFSGTGDLFAALTLARLRGLSGVAGLLNTPGWAPDDTVAALETPLAKAIEVVLGSMHEVLLRTRDARERGLAGMKERGELEGLGEKELHISRTRASELRLVQSQRELMAPVERYLPEELE